MNLNTLIDQVQFKTKISDTVMLPTATIASQLNVAYDIVSSIIVQLNEDFFEEQKTKANTAINSALYPLPTDCMKIKQLRIAYSTPSDEGDYVVATPYDPASVSNVEGDEEDISSSNPIVDITNNFIRIKPTPTAKITNGLELYYVARPSALASGTDTPVIPSEHHDILAVYAAKEVSLKFQLKTRWEILNKEWQEWKDRIMEELAERNINKPARFVNILETSRGRTTTELWN